ncbi:sulfotransferase family protein [uncultured Maricaulis sp.]|uniref:sulfotransferase family protein n=1 Tax=uncultured Maricaulis sp. TaxID=174710 RepID=UPI00261AF287|nr:sulfotransferase family protein [uncultured Maricaulis sp.]
MYDGSRLTAVMMCGAGHSGSTLLGMILGSHSDAFYMGEGGKARYLGDEKKPLRKRVCKICGEDCPVWAGFEWDGETPLYAQVAAHVGKPVIIDSTKDEGWIEARAAEVRSSGGTPVLLMLSRDGRAVVNSRLRKYPDRDPVGQIQAWVDKMAAADALFEAFEGPKMRVRYEDLAENSATTIEVLCRLIGVDYQAGMANFAAVEHHVLGGNSGTQFIAARSRFDDPDEAFVSLGSRTRDYYENHSGRIELDLRWKTEMKPEHLALFEQMAATANAPFQWGE